ncbi:hypothetical protein BDR06DRAFT_1007124 [Suillus hirtellus]|nr:hypothetical protein BDR06DRAFT_1007124 [Suillus hirtellus]
MDEEGLSLAQRRSWHVGIPMPLRYRQYNDVLPQPPPSVPPSRTAQHSESNPPVHSTGTARTLLRAPPFHTAKNVFGLIRQFFSSIPPSHDPEDVITLKDISSVPAMTPAGLDIPAKPCASTQDEEGDEWEDEDAGWRKTQVTIKVPFSQTTAQPGAWPYVAAELYHRPLISVIQEKLSNARDNELFHYEPYELR